MSPADRALMSVARLVMGNRHLRLFVVFYIMALHVLVFFTLFRFSPDACIHDHDGAYWRDQILNKQKTGSDVTQDLNDIRQLLDTTNK
jgi:hypothetical protein